MSDFGHTRPLGLLPTTSVLPRSGHHQIALVGPHCATMHRSKLLDISTGSSARLVKALASDSIMGDAVADKD
jgi:hypothetical protein